LPSFPLAHFAGSDGLSFVEQSRAAGKIVLIHCTAGKSRSPTIAMAYLIQQNGYFIVFLFLSQSSAHYISSRWSLRKSYDFLKRQRDISPNLGFLCSLGEFEKGFFPLLSFSLFFLSPPLPRANTKSLRLFKTEIHGDRNKGLSELHNKVLTDFTFLLVHNEGEELDQAYDLVPFPPSSLPLHPFSLFI